MLRRRKPTEEGSLSEQGPTSPWQRFFRLPWDLVLLQIDFIHALLFFIVKAPGKKVACRFCGELANMDLEVKRCVPVSRYGNLGVARIICPCVKAPLEGVSDVPFCKTPRRRGEIFLRLVMVGLLFAVIWGCVGFALYCYPPSRRLVAQVVKPLLGDAGKNGGSKTQALDPAKALELLGRAETFVEKQQWADARITLLKARALDPKNAAIRNQFASVLLQLKQYPDALSELEKSVKLDPDNIQYLQEFSWLTMMARQPELADAYLDQASENLQQSSEFKLLLGVSLLRRGDRDAALEQLQRIARDAQAQPGTLLQAGDLMLSRFNRPDEALLQIQTAIDQQGEKQPEALLLMAQALRRTGDFSNARSWLDKLTKAGYNEPGLQLELIEHRIHHGEGGMRSLSSRIFCSGIPISCLLGCG